MTPQKYPQNLHAQNIYFSENPEKMLKLKILNPKKMTLAYVCMKISEYPPAPHPPPPQAQSFSLEASNSSRVPVIDKKGQ